MAWVYLVIAGVFEVGWALAMKQAQGFTRLYPSIITIVGMLISFYFLALAIRTLPIGTAYAIWTGIGVIGTVVIGILFMNEPRNLARMICLLLIIVGIIGLKLTTKA